MSDQALTIRVTDKMLREFTERFVTAVTLDDRDTRNKFHDMIREAVLDYLATPEFKQHVRDAVVEKVRHEGVLIAGRLVKRHGERALGLFVGEENADG